MKRLSKESAKREAGNLAGMTREEIGTEAEIEAEIGATEIDIIATGMVIETETGIGTTVEAETPEVQNLLIDVTAIETTEGDLPHLYEQAPGKVRVFEDSRGLKQLDN